MHTGWLHDPPHPYLQPTCTPISVGALYHTSWGCQLSWHRHADDRVIPATCFPRWYETIELDVSVPTNQVTRLARACCSPMLSPSGHAAPERTQGISAVPWLVVVTLPPFRRICCPTCTACCSMRPVTAISLPTEL